MKKAICLERTTAKQIPHINDFCKRVQYCEGLFTPPLNLKFISTVEIVRIIVFKKSSISKLYSQPTLNLIK